MTREHYENLLHQLDDEILAMGGLVADAIGQSVDALERQDALLAQQLIEHDNLIDAKRYDIERDALLVIATQQPLAGDLRAIAAMLTIATELERIGDYCEGIAKLVLRIVGEGMPVPVIDIRAMADVTQELLHQVIAAFQNRDTAAAAEVWGRDDEVDVLYEDVFGKLLADMAADKQKIRQDTYLLWVAHNLERMADRVTNIAERVAFVVTGDIAGFRNRVRAHTRPG